MKVSNKPYKYMYSYSFEGWHSFEVLIYYFEFGKFLNAEKLTENIVTDRASFLQGYLNFLHVMVNG